MQSKITGGDTTLLFTARILNKYDIKYYCCNQTGFIQTENPHWLSEAYSSAITKLDVGLPHRNIYLADKLSPVLAKSFNSKGVFLDYAGGYGLFTRLMRDNGFNFYHTDQYCQNLFAENFELKDLPAGTRFELVTAFEVFEHLPDPLNEIKKMLEFSDSLIFSTELQPARVEKVEDWPYFAVETGQHIAFYTREALQAIAGQLGYNFYTDGKFIHLFTKTHFAKNPLPTQTRDSFLLRKLKKLVKKLENKPKLPESLLLKDFQYVKDKLNNK